MTSRLTALKRLASRVSMLLGEKMDFGRYFEVGDERDGSHAGLAFGSLAKELHYESWDPVTQVYYNRNSQGFVLEVSPLTGATEETVNIFSSVLLDVLPDQMDMQILLWGSDRIGGILEAFRGERSKAGDIHAWIAEKRIRWLAGGAHRSLVSQGTFLLRNVRLFVSVSASARVGQDLSDRLLRTRRELTGSLESMHMAARNLGAGDLIGTVRDMLHPSGEVNPSQVKWNPRDPLSVQMTDPEYGFRVWPDRITMERGCDRRWEARALTVHEYPERPVLWKMEEAIGRLYNTALQIPCPFVLSFSIRKKNRGSSGMATFFKSWDTQKNMAGSGLLKGARLSRKLQELQEVHQRLENGDCEVHTHFDVVLFSDSENADFAERKVRDLYESNRFRLRKSRYLQLQSLLAMLPMRMGDGGFDDFRTFGRLYTMTAFNAANVSPLIAEWHGTKTPVLILPGRRGQVTTFAPFDNETGNYNVVIAAESGKGKTTLAQEYLTGLTGSGGRVWVIDIGHSYKSTCEMLGGTFIEFRPDIDICINPFTHVRNIDEEMELLKPLLAAMARCSSRVTDEENAILEKAIKAAWQSKKNRTTITTVSEWLASQEDPVSKNLAVLLYSYTASGMYGRYFEGDSTVNLDSQLVVLELQDLGNRKDLRRIVMMTLMFRINQVMYLGERTQQKTLILDEFWQHFAGGSEGMGDFIETFARTVRRFTGSMVSISQSINDYFKNSTTISVYENSDYMIVLGQKEESIDQLAHNERFALNPLSEALFKSLKKTDEYSECIIKSPSGLSVHRIMLDPWSRILYSSKGREFDAVRKLRAEGISLVEAVERVAGGSVA